MPGLAEAARAARQTNLLKAEDTQRKQEEDFDSRNKARQDHDKQVACTNARNRYNSLKDAKLYRRQLNLHRGAFHPGYFIEEQKDIPPVFSAGIPRS